MKAAVVALFCAAGGCGSGQRLDECDRLVALVDKIVTCKKLDRAQRIQLEQTVRAMREALDKLDDVGLDQAAGSSVEATRQACAKQHEDLERAYRHSAPACLP